MTTIKRILSIPYAAGYRLGRRVGHLLGGMLLFLIRMRLELVELAGLGLIVTGIARWSPTMAFIASGLAFVAIANRPSRPRQD